MRLISLLLAVVAVLFLGRVVYEFIQFGYLDWVSLILGVVMGALAVALHRVAENRRAENVQPPVR